MGIAAWPPLLLPGIVATFAALMPAPIRYPKLIRFPGAAHTVLVLLAVMPFAGTRWLARAAIVLGLAYAVVGPLGARRVARHRPVRD